METRRWINQSQPQTLYMATILLYVSAAMSVLFGTIFVLFPIGLLYVAAQAAGAYGIANERRWGYMLAVGAVGLQLLLLAREVFVGVASLFSFYFIFSALWPVVLMVLLLHVQSREYQRIWFK
jgi:hypothetical protein